MSDRSLQSKVLADIEKVIESHGFECINVRAWANTGKMSIQMTDEVGELGYVSYDFQDTTMKFEIYIEGRGVPSQPGRSGYYTWYLKHEERAGYQQFRKALDTEVGKLARTAIGPTQAGTFKPAKESAVRKDQVKLFIEKFRDKMKGSVPSTAAGWVDGIGELSVAEKKAVWKGIQGYLDKKSKDDVKLPGWAKAVTPACKEATVGAGHLHDFTVEVTDLDDELEEVRAYEAIHKHKRKEQFESPSEIINVFRNSDRLGLDITVRATDKNTAEALVRKILVRAGIIAYGG
jgi:hypothetical protein